MTKKLLIPFIGALLVGINNVSAQVPINYVFAQDSITGFDEDLAKSKALYNNCFGQEFKSFMYKAKREYVNHKYKLQYDDQIVWKTVQTSSVQPSCTNVDFELGDFTGWTLKKGSNSNSVSMAGCCAINGGVSLVIPAVGNDPVAGALLPLSSPFGGTQIARINNSNANYSVERISQTFAVTSSNAIFQFAYAGVLEAAGHTCGEQPYMNVSVIDSAGNILACPKIVIVAPSSTCTQPASVTAGWLPVNSSPGAEYYHAWDIKTIDLSTYIGTSITIQITVGDCTQGGHYGYGYFDCRCNPMEISLNGTIFDATPTTPIDVSTCGAFSASIVAPLGLDPYLWNGPAGSGVTGVATQSLATSTPGTYTLTMNPTGSCYGAITKYIILHSTPNPTVSNVTAQATCTNATGSSTINVVSGTAPFSYNWLPAASTNSLATGLSPGTNYTVSVVDTFGCRGATTVSIASFTNAPSYTITPLSANLTCLSSSLTVTALTSTNTTAVWTHTNTPNFNVNTAGTYSCVLTNTLSLCTATVPISINSNTVLPIATYTISCVGSTIMLNSAAAGGIALGWLAPSSPPTPIGSQGTSTATGVYTLTATNLTTGCKSTYTVASLVPTLTISANPASKLLTCFNPTIQATTIPFPNTNVIVTWSDGVTTSTVNSLPITTPGTYTTHVQVIGGCATQSVITVTSNTVVGVNLTSPTTIIPCATNSLALTANPTTAGAYSYSWTPSSPSYTGTVYNVSNAGTYTVTAVNNTNGCVATRTLAVTHETVTASFIADPYQGLMPLPVTFTNTSVNATTYSWNLGNGVTDFNTNTSTIYNGQGYYTAVLTAVNGFCVDTAIRIIKVDLVSLFTVPNVFTPNGDGTNDIYTFNAVNMGEITFIVFDRWGLKMFEATDTGNIKWDGKNKGGSTISDGTYSYIINATGLDDVKYDLQGTINVFR